MPNEELSELNNHIADLDLIYRKLATSLRMAEQNVQQFTSTPEPAIQKSASVNVVGNSIGYSAVIDFA